MAQIGLVVAMKSLVMTALAVVLAAQAPTGDDKAAEKSSKPE